MLLKIDGMIEKYTDQGLSEIVSWLERKANVIRLKSFKTVEAS